MDFSRRRRRGKNQLPERLSTQPSADGQERSKVVRSVQKSEWGASKTHMSSCCRGPHGWGTNWSNRPGRLEGPASLPQPAEEKCREKKVDLTSKGSWRHQAFTMSRVIHTDLCRQSVHSWDTTSELKVMAVDIPLSVFRCKRGSISVYIEPGWCQTGWTQV